MNNQERRRAPLELIVFDFDGTLCDSAGVKTDAFYDLYLEDHGPAFAASREGASPCECGRISVRQDPVRRDRTTGQ